MAPHALRARVHFITDGDKLVEMAILHSVEVFGLRDGSSTRWFNYRCRYFDDASGDCTNYDARPATCRDYPYSGRCGQAGCTAAYDSPNAGEVTHIGKGCFRLAIASPG